MLGFGRQMDYSAVASNVQMDYSTVQAIFTICRPWSVVKYKSNYIFGPLTGDNHFCCEFFKMIGLKTAAL